MQNVCLTDTLSLDLSKFQPVIISYVVYAQHAASFTWDDTHIISDQNLVASDCGGFIWSVKKDAGTALDWEIFTVDYVSKTLEAQTSDPRKEGMYSVLFSYGYD